MKKIILSFLLLGLGIVPALSQTYQELCDRAIAYAEQDSLTQAEDYIHRALKLEPANPHNALLFSNLGTIQRRQRDYDQALESYTYALNIAPRTVPILLNRAAIYMELGRNNLAQADYSLALDMEKDNEEALLMRAYIYMQQRDYKMAKADYEHLLRVNPASFNGRLGLATLEQKDGKYEASLSILNSMIAGKEEYSSLTPSQRAMLYVARAGVEKDMLHADIALMDLEEVLRLDASQTEAYLIRGEIYLAQKKKDLAKRDFEKAISLGIPRVDLRDLLKQCR
ncbi:MAG: tetratricopeptide repeat protein [Bacteroides sp.]|nr:tetratricopeptide repeat protein [Bacteroides sp.]